MVKYGDFIHRNGGFIAGMWVISGKMVKKPTEMEVKKGKCGDIW